MNWRLKQLEVTQGEYQKTLELMTEQLETQRQNVKALANKLPIEIRYADEKVRANLIGECLRELLSTRLDVASHEATVAQLVQELDKAKIENDEIDRLKKEKSALQTQAIEMR